MQTQQVSIPRGLRAVSLRAKVASSMQAHLHVDVLVNGDRQVQSTDLLQDIELAASNNGIVTLLTSPKDAEKLIIACETGGIELVPH
jgi:phosphotransferase system HPr-like phosphotransfer protein